MAKIRKFDMIRILTAAKVAREENEKYEEIMAIDRYNDHTGMEEQHGVFYFLIWVLNDVQFSILHPVPEEDDNADDERGKEVFSIIEEDITDPEETYNRFYKEKEVDGCIDMNANTIENLQYAQDLAERHKRILQRLTYTNGTPLNEDDPLRAILELTEIEIL